MLFLVAVDAGKFLSRCCNGDLWHISGCCIGGVDILTSAKLRSPAVESDVFIGIRRCTDTQNGSVSRRSRDEDGRLTVPAKQVISQLHLCDCMVLRLSVGSTWLLIKLSAQLSELV